MNGGGGQRNKKAKAWHRFRTTGESGATAVEFALVLPIFLLIVFGIVEYGWIMIQQILLNHAVSEGARAAVRMPDGASDDERIAEAKEAAMEAFNTVGTLSEDDIDVEILLEAATYLEDYPVPRRVSVEVASWEYSPLVGYLPDAAAPDMLAAKAVFAFP